MKEVLPGDSGDDERLIAIFQSDPDGEEGRRAAGMLLDRWRSRIYLWCLRMVRDRESALDLTQECLLRAYRALPRYDSRGTVGAWFFTIARNRCLSLLRKRPLSRDEEADVEMLMDDQPGLEESRLERDRAERVVRAIDSVLGPLERQVMWLRAQEGLPVDDITRLLSLEGASGARGVLQSARRKLRAELGADFMRGGDASGGAER